VDKPGANAAGGDGSDIGAVETGLPQTGPALTVTNADAHDDGFCTNDDCTLTEAIRLANGNADANTINFAPGVTPVIPAPVSLVAFDVIYPLTINGPGARLLAISGNNMVRAFTIESSAGAVSISGLTLMNGSVSGGSYPYNCGGAIINSASLTLTGCTLTSCSATSHGGAIYNNGVSGDATLTMVNCTLSSNYAAGSGGGIFKCRRGRPRRDYSDKLYVGGEFRQRRGRRDLQRWDQQRKCSADGYKLHHCPE
jgi:hypothetical protein